MKSTDISVLQGKTVLIKKAEDDMLTIVMDNVTYYLSPFCRICEYNNEVFNLTVE